MLKRIIVKDLAIIEDIDLSFKTGMTALTGQTGAGKSLIIDAIGLLLGARADTDLVRYEREEAIVTGYFDSLSDELKEILSNNGIVLKEELEITRKISLHGNSQIKVNDSSVTLNTLKQIGLFLGDIHVQHDTYRLINKDNYLSFLDDYHDESFLKVFNNYQLKKHEYLRDLKTYEETTKRSFEAKNHADTLEFEKKELEALELEEDIDIKLEEEINKLSNFDKIYQALNVCYETLNSESFNRDLLYDSLDNLKDIKEFDKEYENCYNLVSDAYYNLEDVSSYLYKAKDSLDFDPDYLDSLNSKLYEINHAKDKYHKGVNELIKYLEDITLELNLINNYDEAIKELLDNVKKSHQDLVMASSKLSDVRKKKAKEIEKQLVNNCLQLDLEHTQFEISFQTINLEDPLNSKPFLDNGIDDIDFLITFNKGEPVKPLSKVASGGELSRVMLAFKIIYLNTNKLSFMVFDEIDSGISGSTARKIGKMLHKLSGQAQVLCITHLAQVASLADTQLQIEKELQSGRTRTIVKELSYKERISNLAIMLSGMEVNEALLKTAEELLNNK